MIAGPVRAANAPSQGKPGDPEDLNLVTEHGHPWPPSWRSDLSGGWIRGQKSTSHTLTTRSGYVISKAISLISFLFSAHLNPRRIGYGKPILRKLILELFTITQFSTASLILEASRPFFFKIGEEVTLFMATVVASEGVQTPGIYVWEECCGKLLG